jgi:8-oxo-dGTP pyrophosphatase MutT (NUDIX family)
VNEIRELLQKLARDVAPGIPSKKIKRVIPTVTEPTTWDYARQHHYAHRAGFHTDLRISDGQRAFSWAIRHFPEKPGEQRLALRQPDHRKGYMKWEGEIPAHVYGGGKVVLHDIAKTEILEAGPDKIRFNLYHKREPQEFVLIKTDDKKNKDRWLIKNVTLTRKQDKSTVIPETKPVYKETVIDKPEKYLGPEYVASAKLEGAHSLFYFDGKKIRAMSYRPTQRQAGIIDHTYKMPKAMLQKVAPELKGTLLRGEIYGVDKHGKALASQEVSGLLNSSVQKARETQAEKGHKLVPAIFDIVKYRGKDVTHLPYEGKLQIIQKIINKLKHFEIPRLAHTKQEKAKLISDIKSGREPKTKEGVVFWNLKDPKAAPVKAKIRPDYDIYVREVFEGEGKYEKHAGGFTYSLTSSGPIIGRVGTGLSDTLRKDMWTHKSKYVGKVAKVTAQEQFPSGALRAPAFVDWHIEKGKQASLEDPVMKRPPGLEAGRAAGHDEEEFDADQILKGIEVEHEHTDKDNIAKAISMDHLTEDPKYYTHLKAMEDKYQKKASLGMLRAYAMYLEKKAQSNKLYRDRVEVYALKDGKILGGIYPDGNFGIFGGGIDPGETAKKAARREFLEESGYEVKHLHPAYIPAVKSRWSEDDMKRLAKKDPKRIKQYQGSRTIFFIADLGDRIDKNPEDKTKLKHVKLYPFEEALDLIQKSGDNQRLLDARIKLVRNLIKYEKTAQLLEPLLSIR